MDARVALFQQAQDLMKEENAQSSKMIGTAGTLPREIRKKPVDGRGLGLVQSVFRRELCIAPQVRSRLRIKGLKRFFRIQVMDEERFLKVYEEIMQCSEADARCVFMFVSSQDRTENDAPVGIAQTSF